MDVGRPSLDQLAAFVAVVDAGSFHAAARRLGRAVSAVSYAITTLEAQLGVAVFDREGSRRPVLTAAGKAILAHARGIGEGVDALVAGVRARNSGMESELVLVVDVMCPQAMLSRVLREFQIVFPTVDLRLLIESLGAVADLVVSGEAELGVAGPVIAEQPELELVLVGEVDLVPVASPDHPLAQMGTILPGAGRAYRQLVLTDRSRLTEGQEFGVLGTRTWRLGDLGAKHALLREGIGWGNMPMHMIARDLAEGRLVRLAMPEAPRTVYPLRAAWRRDCPAGPARSWLVEALAQGCAGTCPVDRPA